MPADIVYIDDEPQQLISAATALRAGLRFDQYVPPHLNGAAEAAAIANLWVFDFFNDDGQRLNPNLDGVGSNGLSVFQQFRLLVGDARPPAVLVSNHLEEALGAEINPERRHIVAEQVGVEWVAPKIHGQDSVIPEILSIADAVAKLKAISARLGAAKPDEYIAELSHLALGLPKNAGWTRAAISDVATWRPPAWIDAVPDQRPEVLQRWLPVNAEQRPARSLIAWLLRQVLQHPSFIVRDRHVAVRLGLTLACIRAALVADTALAKKLKRMSYRGVLADFDGQRWWSAGIDALAWDLPRPKQARAETLKKLLAPVSVEELSILDPVVVSNADLVETDEIAPVAECVRATEDHFPPQARPAWVPIEDARRDKLLARKVQLEDQAELAVST